MTTDPRTTTDRRWSRRPCRDVDTDIFYPEKEDGGSTEQAKRICGKPCPVRALCLARAMANDEPYGVWGGLSTWERRKLKDSGWQLGDPLPPIRFPKPRVLAHVDRAWAEETFEFAATHGTRWAKSHYRVSQDTLQRVWDRYELGRPRQRGGSTGHPRNTAISRSREWAEQTLAEAKQTSIAKVCRARHVSHMTLRRAWKQHNLGTPTARTA